MSLWHEMKQNLSDLYCVAAVKTSEFTKVQERRIDKFGLRRDLDRQLGELGSLVYRGLQEGRNGILEDPALAEMVRRVGLLEQELRSKEEEIARIRQEYAQRKGTAAAAANPGGAGAAEPSGPTQGMDGVQEHDEHDPQFRG